MFQIGSAYRCRALRSQGEFVSASIFKGIHLLFYNVCFFAYSSEEKTCVLKGGGVNALIAIELTEVNYFFVYVAPVCLFLG